MQIISDILRHTLHSFCIKMSAVIKVQIIVHQILILQHIQKRNIIFLCDLCCRICSLRICRNRTFLCNIPAGNLRHRQIGQHDLNAAVLTVLNDPAQIFSTLRLPGERTCLRQIRPDDRRYTVHFITLLRAHQDIDIIRSGDVSEIIAAKFLPASVIQFEVKQEFLLCILIMNQVLHGCNFGLRQRPAVHVQMELLHGRFNITLTCTVIHFIQIMIVFFQHVGIHHHDLRAAVVQRILHLPVR